MNIIGFVGFFLVSLFGLMFVLRISTYHRYFWWSLPFLLGYAALVGWALFTFEMHGFFIWYLSILAVLLFLIGRKDRKTVDMMFDSAGDNADEIRFIAESAARTSTYYTASCLLYLATFAFTYLWLYNAQFSS